MESAKPDLANSQIEQEPEADAKRAKKVRTAVSLFDDDLV